MRDEHLKPYKKYHVFLNTKGVVLNKTQSTKCKTKINKLSILKLRILVHQRYLKENEKSSPEL